MISLSSPYVFNTIADYVQQEADLTKIVSAYLPLMPGHKALKALPFSLRYFRIIHGIAFQNSFRCFGCGKDGATVEFLMVIEGKSHEEAIMLLAEQLR